MKGGGGGGLNDLSVRNIEKKTLRNQNKINNQNKK